MNPQHLPHRRPLLHAALALLGLAWPALASANDSPALNIQAYRPAPGLLDGQTVRAATAQDPLAVGLLASLHYTSLPLRFVSSASGVRQTQTVVGDLLMTDLGASVGLTGGWTLAVAMPIAEMIRGGGPNIVQIQQPSGPAFGDLRAELRKTLVHMVSAGFATDVAVAAVGEVPTAARNSWLGGAGTAGLEVLASGARGPWRTDANVGVRYMPTQALWVQDVDPATGLGKPGPERAVLRAGSQWVVRAGVLRRWLDDKVRTRAEVQATGPLGVTALPPGQAVVDGFLSCDMAFATAWRAFVAVSGAPTSGPGSAAWRGAIGVALDMSRLPHDEDGDGIDDRVDKCPNEAEDKDGFEDADGCPDPDNDQDGILDAVDQCPLVPEDLDGFEDADGCPDPDNDNDGILDKDDKCPNEPEDFDGFEDRDGCPDPDNDGDGIPDTDDLCPLSPENKNGFEDQDGCPDVAPAPAPAPVVEPAPAPAPETAPAPAAPAARSHAKKHGKAAPHVRKHH